MDFDLAIPIRFGDSVCEIKQTGVLARCHVIDSRLACSRGAGDASGHILNVYKVIHPSSALDHPDSLSEGCPPQTPCIQACEIKIDGDKARIECPEPRKPPRT